MKSNVARVLPDISPEPESSAAPNLQPLSNKPSVSEYTPPLLRRHSVDISDAELSSFLYFRPPEVLLRNTLRTCSIDHLLELLTEEDEATRRNAAAALGERGPKARKSVPVLVAALGDSSAAVRYSAAIALGRIGVHGETTIPALIYVLKSESSLEPLSPLFAASIALSQLARHKPNSVLAMLWRASSSKQKQKRIAACCALYQIGIQFPKILLPSLHRCERSRVAALRQNARVIRKKLEARNH